MSRINFQNVILLGICILFKLNAYGIAPKSENSGDSFLGQVKSSKADLATNVIYIDPSATVNGTGTQDSPWNGSTLASNPWQANTTYLFKRGTTYSHTTAIILQLPGLTFGAYGTGANPIIQTTNDHNFNGYGTGTDYGDMGILTIQDLELIAPSDASAANVFQIAFMYAKGNVNITNCKIHGGYQGIRFLSCPAINVKVTGCEVYDIWSDGLYIYQVNSFESDNNHVYNVNLSHPSGYPDDGDCIHMDDIPTIWIHNTILDHSSQPGKFCILVGATTTTFVGNAIIENNTLKRQRGGNDNTILYDGYAHGSQVIFRYNVVQDALLGLQSRSYDMQIYYNVFSNLDEFMELSAPKDYVSHAKIWNNTIYNCGAIIAGYGELVDFKNNIIHTATGNSFNCGSNITSDYNDYYNVTTIGGLSKGTHDIAVDPQFNNPSASDFTLAKGSKCIDAGTNVMNTTIDIKGTTAPVGSSIDMGAYEFNAADPGGTTNKPPVISIASPVNGSSFTAQAVITIKANASDSDGTINKVEFYNGAVKLGESATAPYTYTWNNVPAGTYSLTAVAIDNANAQTTSSVVTAYVNNQAATENLPVINITSPSNGNNYTAPASLNITVSASDPDGVISKVQFYNGNIKLGESAIAPYSFELQNVSTGSYDLKAVAIDNSNLQAASNVVTIWVNGTVSDIPSVDDPESFKIYPNPTRGRVSISIPAIENNAEVTIIDLSGKTVYIGSLNSTTSEFDLTNFKSGDYIMVVKLNNKSITKRFVKL